VVLATGDGAGDGAGAKPASVTEMEVDQRHALQLPL
jgi:hypothetical protein